MTASDTVRSSCLNGSDLQTAINKEPAFADSRTFVVRPSNAIIMSDQHELRNSLFVTCLSSLNPRLMFEPPPQTKARQIYTALENAQNRLASPVLLHCSRILEAQSTTWYVSTGDYGRACIRNSSPLNRILQTNTRNRQPCLDFEFRV